MDVKITPNLIASWLHMAQTQNGNDKVPNKLDDITTEHHTVLQNVVHGIMNVVRGNQYNAQGDINITVVVPRLITIAFILTLTSIWLIPTLFNKNPTLVPQATATPSCPPLNWQDIGTLKSIFMMNADEGWAVGENGTILYYKQSCWAKYNSPAIPKEHLTSISMKSSAQGWVGYIVGDNDTALKYYAEDPKWRIEPPLTFTNHAVELKDVAVVSATSAWIVGYDPLPVGSIGGFVVEYRDGHYQAPIYTSTGQYLYGIYMLSPQRGWAVGQYTILRYIDGEWGETKPSVDAIMYSIQISSSEHSGWAVGSDNPFVHYDGKSWQIYDSDIKPPPFMESVFMNSDNEGWAVGSGVIAYYSGVWKIFKQTNKHLYDIFMVTSTDGWAVGKNAIFHYTYVEGAKAYDWIDY